MQIQKYCWQQILLHWVSAMVIIWALISSFYVAHVNVTPATLEQVAFINVAMTSLFIPLMLLHIAAVVLHESCGHRVLRRMLP